MSLYSLVNGKISLVAGYAPFNLLDSWDNASPDKAWSGEFTKNQLLNIINNKLESVGKFDNANIPDDTEVPSFGFNTDTETMWYWLDDTDGWFDSGQQLDLSVYQLISNLVTVIDESSTDTQYPSAKAVFDAIQSINNPELELAIETLQRNLQTEKNEREHADGRLQTTIDYLHFVGTYEEWQALEQTEKAKYKQATITGNIPVELDLPRLQTENEVLNYMSNIFSVGYIYETTDTNLSTPQSVATKFGFGTWEKFGDGKVLIGQGTGYDLNATGGSVSNTLLAANLPAHTHSIPALTTGNQSANHNHTINHSHTYHGFASTDSNGSGGKQFKSRVNTTSDPSDYGGDAFSGSSGNNSANHTHTTSATNTGSIGSGTAVNNLPPYIVVYRYRRIS